MTLKSSTIDKLIGDKLSGTYFNDEEVECLVTTQSFKNETDSTEKTSILLVKILVKKHSINLIEFIILYLIFKDNQYIRTTVKYFVFITMLICMHVNHIK